MINILIIINIIVIISSISLAIVILCVFKNSSFLEEIKNPTKEKDTIWHIARETKHETVFVNSKGDEFHQVKNS